MDRPSFSSIACLVAAVVLAAIVLIAVSIPIPKREFPPVVQRSTNGTRVIAPDAVPWDTDSLLPCHPIGDPPSSISIGRNYRHRIEMICDDGPYPFPLEFSLVAAPPGMTCRSDGAIDWIASTPGEHNVSVFVTDGCWHASLSWIVHVTF